jgi:hypothetical protein
MSGTTNYGYVCDGKSGATFGQGTGNLDSCVTNLNYSIHSNFILKKFKVRNVQISDLSLCIPNKQLDIYLTVISSGTLLETSGKYQFGDQIHCSKSLAGEAIATFDNSSSCNVERIVNGSVSTISSITLSEIYSLDLTDEADGLGLEIS